MRDPLSTITTRQTPQSQPADPRQVPNAAGGHAFKVGDDTRVHRFLTLGTDGGTYYTGERAHTADNAAVILNAARTRGQWLVEEVVKISVGGRAPRQNPALFALAAAASVGDVDTRRDALRAVPQVCRTGTHLFTFARYAEQFRGWGRGLARAVAAWYLVPSVESVAYQTVKYRQREGWSHRDLLRLAHPRPADDDRERRALFEWITHGIPNNGGRWEAAPEVVRAFDLAQAVAPNGEASAEAWSRLIVRYPVLSWEMLPDAALGHVKVWRALISNGMPITALMRQLPRLTRLGVLDDPETRERVVDDLTSADRLKRGRVHPVNVLVAMRTYAAGVSTAGSSRWDPNPRIVDALDSAFYAAYGAVEPAGKRTLVALDVSGSMGMPVSGLPLSCREAATAVALVTLATEPNADVVGFTSGIGTRLGGHGVSMLSLSARQRLDDAVRSIANLPFGGTDCAAPMMWAADKGRAYDSFMVVTDNETWAGRIHPHQALARYRQRMIPDARLAVVGMTATDVSIADPADPGQMDVAGFDSAVPQLLAAFFRGDV